MKYITIILILLIASTSFALDNDYFSVYLPNQPELREFNAQLGGFGRAHLFEYQSSYKAENIDISYNISVLQFLDETNLIKFTDKAILDILLRGYSEDHLKLVDLKEIKQGNATGIRFVFWDMRKHARITRLAFSYRPYLWVIRVTSNKNNPQSRDLARKIINSFKIQIPSK